jgi:hypothetical protein
MAMKKTVKPKPMPKPKAKRPSASAGKSNPKAAAKGKGTGTKTEYEWKIPARAGAKKPLKELKATTKAKAADKAKRIAIGNENMREAYNASKDSKMPRTKQLSSYKKDGGASRNFMRRGGKGK